MMLAKNLKLEFDVERLLLEYENLLPNEKFYGDDRGSSLYWKVIRHEDMSSEYCKNLAKNIKHKYNIEGRVDARFYRLLANELLPFHTDRGTQCSINVILSNQPAPISFRIQNKISNHYYNVALINTQHEHSVQNGSEDRILFKISIFDENFDSVAAKIT
jgi:hypothetical protein